MCHGYGVAPTTYDGAAAAVEAVWFAAWYCCYCLYCCCSRPAHFLAGGRSIVLTMKIGVKKAAVVLWKKKSWSVNQNAEKWSDRLFLLSRTFLRLPYSFCATFCIPCLESERMLPYGVQHDNQFFFSETFFDVYHSSGCMLDLSSLLSWLMSVRDGSTCRSLVT